MSTEANLLSEANIESYVSGSELIAVTLDDVVFNVLQAGKKPTILIPSRGAVPIYLLAVNMLADQDNEHILVDQSRTRYYPNGIFEYLSAGRMKQNGPTTSEIDVVLYPFTADVSSEKEEETLARKLRYSATRAFIDLVAGERTSLDLQWYFFLMSKMHETAYSDSKSLNPAAIVESIKQIEPLSNRQIIIIDTVISGRASSQILKSFRDLDHPATPILAVDYNGSNRFQRGLKSAMRRNMNAAFLPDGSTEAAFVEFPLITEDKGAGLLGVAAINFSNFNGEGFFKYVDSHFPDDFLPQSCIWALPPGLHQEVYGKLFHKYLELCMRKARGEEMEGLEDFQKNIKPLIAGYGIVDYSEAKMLANIDREATAKESSSHIVSIALSAEQAESWIREFARPLF